MSCRRSYRIKSWVPSRAKRHLALAAASLVVGCCTLATVGVGGGSAGASIGSDRSQEAAIEHFITAEGDRIQTIVENEDRVQGRLTAVEGHITQARNNLAFDRRLQKGAANKLRSVAVNTYVDASSGVTSPLLASSSASSAAEQQVYSGVASSVLDAALANYERARHRTAVTVAVLRREKGTLNRALVRLSGEKRQAMAAIEKEQSVLGKVKGNLLALVTEQEERAQAAAEQKEEEEQAAAEERAREKAAADPPPTTTVTTTTTPSSSSSPPPPPTHTVTGNGTYADPLRSISGLVPERIDQGVDYSGFGPIYAIGDGVVVNTVNGGWPGGTFIVYQLTSGPASGLFVYAAEDINPSVSVGEQVTSNTVLGQMYEGPDGIETGWADGSAIGESMAAEYGQFSGANSTAFGYNFSQLLETVGAPGGVLQNSPPTGSLPAGWPQW